MKKLMRIGAGILVIFVALIVILPFALRGTVEEKIKEAIDENVDATIGLESVSLSLISEFPLLSIDVNGLTVDGKGDFEDLRMVDIGSLHLAINLFDVWSDEGVTLRNFSMDQVKYHLVVLANGKANWDIAKESVDEESAEVEENTVESDSPFQLALQSYALTNHSLIYDDREGDIYFEIQGLNHSGSGDFTASQFDLITSTDWSSMDCSYEGTRYLKEVGGSLVANLGVDMETMTIRFDDNVLKANGLELAADGAFTMGETQYDMDLTFSSPNTDFGAWWSLVPSAYTAEYNDVKTSGAVAFDGYVKGTYRELPGDTVIPAFGLALNVENASVQYPDLPESISALFVDFEVESPSSDMDQMVVDLREMSADLGLNKLWLSFHLDHPMSDPNIKFESHSQINLASFADFMPVENTLTGSITADLMFAGKQSDVENEKYDAIEAGGKLMIIDMEYYSEMFHMPMYIRSLYSDWSTQHVAVNNAAFEWGQSDVRMNGKLQNLLFYYLGDAPLQGELNVSSDTWNVDEWMAVYDAMPVEESDASDSTATANTSDEVYEPFILPSDVELKLTASVDEIVYDSYAITNLKGRLDVLPYQLVLDHLDMNMLGGSAGLNGVIHTPVDGDVHCAYDMRVSGWDISTIATSANSIAELVPILESTKGSLSGSFDWDCDLDSALDMRMESVVSEGDLQAKNLKIESSVLKRVDETLKSDRFYPMAIDDVSLSYTIKDGKVEVEPFEFNVDQTKSVASGYTMIDGSINYLVETTTPIDALGAAGADWVGAIQGQLSDLGVSEEAIGDEIDLNIRITGSTTDPVIRPEFGGVDQVATDVKEQVKEVIIETIEEKKEEIREDLQERADQIIADARKQADDLNAEAKRRADQIRSEGDKAADLIRDEAKKRAEQLEAEASNMLEKRAAKLAADKLLKEAEEKAQDVEAEADRNADKVEQEAKKQGDAIIATAEQQADDLLKSE